MCTRVRSPAAADPSTSGASNEKELPWSRFTPFQWATTVKDYPPHGTEIRRLYPTPESLKQAEEALANWVQLTWEKMNTPAAGITEMPECRGEGNDTVRFRGRLVRSGAEVNHVFSIPGYLYPEAPRFIVVWGTEEGSSTVTPHKYEVTTSGEVVAVSASASVGIILFEGASFIR